MNSPTVGTEIRQSSEKYFANRRKSVEDMPAWNPNLRFGYLQRHAAEINL